MTTQKERSMRRIFVPFRKTWLFPMLLAAVLLVGVATTVNAQTTLTWQLMNYHQSSCFDTNVHDTYYGIWIKGTWSHQINVGITHLPKGGSYTADYAPIAPGSSDGVGSLAYVHTTIPANTPVGNYTARLWASDETTRETVPVTLVIKASCGY
jgi:hypothetical protein